MPRPIGEPIVASACTGQVLFVDDVERVYRTQAVGNDVAGIALLVYLDDSLSQSFANRGGSRSVGKADYDIPNDVECSLGEFLTNRIFDDDLNQSFEFLLRGIIDVLISIELRLKLERRIAESPLDEFCYAFIVIEVGIVSCRHTVHDKDFP